MFVLLECKLGFSKTPQHLKKILVIKEIEQ
jgi:hypothetical protein